MSDPLQPHGLQHTRLPCPSLFPEVCSNSCPSSLWCHPTVSSSIIPFSSCPQSFPASGSFPMKQFLTSDGQNIIGASALASVLLMNIQYWFSLGLTGLISLPSKLHFSFVQISQTVVQNGCAILCSHQQCMSDPVALHLHQHLILSLSFILVILKSSNDIFRFYFAFP